MYDFKFISIHAAQEGCDGDSVTITSTGKIFQSTQPKRAATEMEVAVKVNESISIHAAQEGCDWQSLHRSRSGSISIHAAQEGCDVMLLVLVLK